MMRFDSYESDSNVLSLSSFTVFDNNLFSVVTRRHPLSPSTNLEKIAFGLNGLDDTFYLMGSIEGK